MQYSASSFVQPATTFFAAFLRTRQSSDGPGGAVPAEGDVPHRDSGLVPRQPFICRSLGRSAGPSSGCAGSSTEEFIFILCTLALTLVSLLVWYLGLARAVVSRQGAVRAVTTPRLRSTRTRMNYGTVSMSVSTIMPCALALVGAPLLLGITNRTKAIFAGRNGPPLRQPYYDLWKLLQQGGRLQPDNHLGLPGRPGDRAGQRPVATIASALRRMSGALFFAGDLILFAYLLGLARVFTVLAALDTGSSFEGMGASREVLFSALAEPSLLLALAAVARQTGSLSLSDMHLALSTTAWGHSALLLNLVAVVLLVVFLAENSRIPVDDPNTHLELTMIHEVMVLDHGGPDLAFILYAAALKLWLFGALIVDLVIPARFGIVACEPRAGAGGHGGVGRPARRHRVGNGATPDDARARALDRRGDFGRPGPGAGIRRGPLVNCPDRSHPGVRGPGEPDSARLEPARRLRPAQRRPGDGRGGASALGGHPRDRRPRGASSRLSSSS